LQTGVGLVLAAVWDSKRMSIFVRNGGVAAKRKPNAPRAVVVRSISAGGAVPHLSKLAGMD